jgi:hypothetical protein
VPPPYFTALSSRPQITWSTWSGSATASHSVGSRGDSYDCERPSRRRQTDRTRPSSSTLAEAGDRSIRSKWPPRSGSNCGHPSPPPRLRRPAGGVRGGLPSAPAGDQRGRPKPNHPSLHEPQGGSHRRLSTSRRPAHGGPEALLDGAQVRRGTAAWEVAPGSPAHHEAGPCGPASDSLETQVGRGRGGSGRRWISSRARATTTPGIAGNSLPSTFRR